MLTKQLKNKNLSNLRKNVFKKRNLIFYYFYGVGVLVVVCLEIMTLVTDFFFLLPFTCYLLFVCWSCKGIKDGKRDKDTFKLNFHFRCLQLFSGVECFPEPVRIAVLPTEMLKDSPGSFWQIVNRWYRVYGVLGCAMCVGGQSVCPVCDVATSGRHHALLSQRS